MADCAYFEELIGAGLDGELTEAEEAALRAHLETCESCRAFSAALRGISESLADELPQPPADLTDRIMDSVRAQAAPKKAKIVPMPRFARYAALAAVVAVAVLAGVRFGGLGMRKAAPAAAPQAPMAAMSAAGAEEAAAKLPEDAGAPAAPEPRTEAAVNGAAAITESAEAEAVPEMMDSAEAAPEEREATLFDMPMAAAVPAARPEYRLYRGDAGELLASGTDEDGLLSRLTVDTPRPAPDRAPDFVLAITTSDGNEARFELWEEDGTILLRDPEGSCGAALSAERFRELFGIG